MYLKALELENFKSFRGEVEIPLDRGFTAITGPNGSGKSNCGDAIQFVLGPRSNKSLRAGNVKGIHRYTSILHQNSLQINIFLIIRDS